MFSVKHNECVGFESKWTVRKVSTNTSSQTTEFSTSEKGCTTTELTSKEVQTDIVKPSTERTDPDAEMENLAKWLKKIYPQVKNQLDKANNSKAFRNYKLMDGPVDVTCKLLQNLFVVSKAEGDKALPIIACLEWSPSGKILAVVHNFKHKTWCHHSGVLCLYTFSRNDMLSENPKKRLTTESCITCIQFHPTNGNILVAGTFTGHIYIWNVENDVDSLIYETTAHEEYITQASWIYDTDVARTVLLASSSTDGLLKVWQFNNPENCINIGTVYKVKIPIFGILNSNSKISKSLLDKNDLGIVCFDFSIHQPDIFVVATEGGVLARCSVLGATELKGPSIDKPYWDPVYTFYEPHKGEISIVKFCLQRKDLFLTSGTDGEIRIYLLDQEDPAQIIFTKSPITDFSFIPHEEKLLACCGEQGTLEVFHLESGKNIELHFNARPRKRLLTNLTIHNFRTNFVALGNNNGEVQLWNVPWSNIAFKSRT
ncbi:cytoplasmic dynein 2 intermediate chain 2-like [Anthonomus grandis grandis]|uniref:cytoplasmic dynein 2 intermediate chain 2-like n=1 Tax=Anthonomus grandis grandis TaxID=2921223 RepID=UPI002165E37B|nr:cytoplasmic dynein 2 intermediate chain 2-like [Anthonomus grandis grandis]